MSYPPQNHPPLGQNQRPADPRAYQPRTIAPQVRVDEVVYSAPTLGQYFRSDTRGLPGARKRKWAGRLAFWFGLGAVVLMWSSLVVDIPFHAGIALAFSVTALFFGLVAVIAGIGRGVGILGILLALLGNALVVSWLGENVF